MINQYGFYLPLDQYIFVFWKDLAIYILVILSAYFFVRWRLAAYISRKVKYITVEKKVPVIERADTESDLIKRAIKEEKDLVIHYYDYESISWGLICLLSVHYYQYQVN